MRQPERPAAGPIAATRRALPTARLAWAGGVIGFSLGGFFDGILLHQVLQWHHLFSLVPGEIWRDIRAQIMMDGWFHVLHFVIALAGLGLLWRARREFSGAGSDRKLIGATLLGFSCWQFVDVVLFHWILVIHRIRVDVPNPLAYDLGWLALFGVTSLLAGLWLWRRAGAGGAGLPASALAGLVAIAAPWAAQAPAGSHTIVVFGPNTTARDAFEAVAAIDRRVIWTDEASGLMLVDQVSFGNALQLYRRGALMVGSGPFSGSCLSWVRT